MFLAVLGCAGGDDGDDDVAADDVEVTTTTAQETTTTEESTTTTERTLDNPEDVIGLAIADALGDLRDAGIEAQQVEVIDQSADDGEVIDVVEQPDGSVVLTVARPPVARFLERLTPVEGSVSLPNFNVSGTTYTHGIARGTCGTVSAVVEYDMGRDFRRFQAVAGLLDTSAADLRERVEIAVDGSIVATHDLALGETIPIDLDVTGGLRLRITVSYLSGGGCQGNGIGLGDARLVGVPSEVPPESN